MTPGVRKDGGDAILSDSGCSAGVNDDANSAVAAGKVAETRRGGVSGLNRGGFFRLVMPPFIVTTVLPKASQVLSTTITCI